MAHPIKKLSQVRLLKWYLVAITLLAIITLISPQQLPVVAYKLALVLLSAVIGYHLDRALFPYASPGGYLYNDWKKFGPDFYTQKYIESQEQPDAIDSKMRAEYPVLDDYRNLFAFVLIRRALIVSAVILGVTLGL